MDLIPAPLRHVTRALARRSVRPPFGHVLEPARQQIADEVLARLRPLALRLREGLEAGDVEARRRLAQLATNALEDLRVALPATAGARHALLARIDDRWRTRRGERASDPAVEPTRKARLGARLDRFHDLTGTHEAFLGLLAPHLRPGAAVLELAGGSGAFSRTLARHSNELGLGLDVVCSDTDVGALDAGREAALAEGLEVRFERLHPLDLREATGRFDVVTSAGALHRFPSGDVTLMVEEAARAAERAVVVLDGYRSALSAGAMTLAGLTLFRSLDFVHDGVVSYRRFFTPVELELLGRMAPRADAARVSWTRPGHLALTLDVA
ncbi:MAG: methyltransferase domain-containing protein [Myxococcota bacterium]